MSKRRIPFALFPVLVLLATAATAFAATKITKRGQALTASKLAKSVRMPGGKYSRTTLTLRTSRSSSLCAYAVSTTKFFKRGTNDDSYHPAPMGDAYTVFTSWGGGGYCPSTFVYTQYRSKGKTYRVLSKVYYFMSGE